MQATGRIQAFARGALHDNRRMLARVTAFVVWAIVAAVAVFWALKLLVRPASAPSFTVPVSEATAVRGDLSRLFGRTAVATANAPAAPELASRFKLLGVMAPKASGGDIGVALIAVDGKPPRAYSLGAKVDGELVLQSVSLRNASIGPAAGAAAVTLEVPRLPTAATGTLPPVTNNYGAAATPPPPRPATPVPAVTPPTPQVAPIQTAVPPSNVPSPNVASPIVPPPSGAVPPALPQTPPPIQRDGVRTQ